MTGHATMAAPPMVVRRYEPGDAERRLEFDLRLYGPGTRQVDQERFAWLYERNPFRSPEGYDYWLAEAGGHLVGHQAQIVHELSIRGARHLSSWGVDLMADPGFRNRTAGPALINNMLSLRPIGGGINASVRGRRAGQTFGASELGYVSVYIRPLDLRAVTGERGSSTKVRAAAGVGHPVLRTVDRSLARAGRAGGALLEPVDRFDPRVDEVWRASAPDYPVLMVRDYEATRWRLDDRPDRDCLLRYYFVVKGRTLGYVAMRPSRRSSAMVVVDYLAPTRWVAPMLTLAASEAGRHGAGALVCKTVNPRADPWLRRAGFLKRDRGLDQEMLFSMICNDEQLAGDVLDIEKWFVTAADADLEPGTTPEGVDGS